MQNFRLDSGNCVLNYTPTTGDAIIFDSQMSCSYRLGLIVSRGDGAAVRFAQRLQDPIASRSGGVHGVRVTEFDVEGVPWEVVRDLVGAFAAVFVEEHWPTATSPSRPRQRFCTRASVPRAPSRRPPRRAGAQRRPGFAGRKSLPGRGPS